jgi:hypothetical protein
MSCSTVLIPAAICHGGFTGTMVQIHSLKYLLLHLGEYHWGGNTTRFESCAWGDYDNDGKLDALFVGWPYSALYHNNGNDSFTNSGISIPTPPWGDVAWGDYNNDGNLDFVVNGGGGTGMTALYENLGNGLIVPATNVLTGVYSGSAAWEDFNNDGNLDLAVTGLNNNLGYITQIYVGDGHGGFTNFPVNIDGTVDGTVAWGDFDNDGLPDLVISWDASTGTTKIYHNNGDGTFTDTGVSLPGCGNGGIAVGDFNHDGKLDIAIVGGGVAKIFRNDSNIPTNTPPSPPTNLTAVPTTNAMLLSWSTATDANQNGGLNYNIRMGTTPRGIDVVGPMADPATGFRRIPAIGNAGLCLKRTVTHLHSGTYYWSVQTIDHDFAGSAFPPEQNFSIAAPTITTQPLSQTNAPETAASFQVTADGTSPISYQWYFNGVPLADNERITGSSSTNLALASVQVPDAGDYMVVAVNVAGSITSVVAILTVTAPPVITSQPTNVSVVDGATAAFEVLAAGTGPFVYQWQFDETNIDGATSDTLSLTNVQMNQAGPYDVVVSNIYGRVVSSNALLTVMPLAVIIQPGSQSADAGATISFNAAVTGQGPFTYQWQFGTTNIANATNSTLTLTYLQDGQAGAYDVVVSNGLGSVTSAEAQLSVIPWPIIEPQKQTNLIGTTVSLTGIYGGPTPPFYQWYFNGNPLSDGGQFSGATNSSLTISNIQNFNIGSYQVAVGTGTNVLTSPTALLIVTNYGPAVRYVNSNNPNPNYPYLDWSTAATNIQDAIDAAFDGDQILVTNGNYSASGRVVYGSPTTVVVNRVVTMHSLNGPTVTSIVGNNAMRCVYLTNGAMLAGFTLTTGNAGTGGGVYCASTNNVVVSNCVISACVSSSQGGGAYQGTLIDCMLANNFSSGNGGGAASALLSFCRLATNSAANGGGAYLGVINNCIVINNAATSTTGGGGGTYNSMVFNSAIADNSAANNSQSYTLGGYGGGAYGGTLVNCTISGNYASIGGGVANCALTNCIIFYNTYFSNVFGLGLTGVSNYYYGSSLDHCCTTPLPSGTGNIANEPMLGSISHITLNSPCRAAGNATAASGVDIDGEPWANPPSIGCDEIYPGTVTGSVTVAISTAFTNLAPGYAGSFQANISGPVNASKWDFGDGTVVSNKVYVSHTWSATGDYPVMLTACNDTFPAGVSATLIMHITVPTVYYVNLYSTNPIAPYSYWSTAATTIQDAIDAATPGSLVLVTNGTGPLWYQTNNPTIYQSGGRVIYGSLTNRVAIDKPITVESVNGPSVTYIQGNLGGGSTPVRCVYMTNGATLIGFTLTNGSAQVATSDTRQNSGGGIWSESTNVVITNCVITGCFAAYAGGGVYSGSLYNCTIISNSSPFVVYGTVYSSLLDNCLLIGNTIAGGYGGAAANCTLFNCTIISNSVQGGYGGGTYLCLLTNCMLVGNSTTHSGNPYNEGGGAFGGSLTNCTLIGNSANDGGAAAGGAGAPIVLNNCLISSNVATYEGGGAYAQPSSNAYTNCILNNCALDSNSAAHYGGGAFLAELNNCTVSNNSAVYPGGGGGGGGVEGGLLNNCVLNANIANNGGGADGSTSVGFPILSNCVLLGNVATNGTGGGANFCILNNCTLSGNKSWSVLGPFGGGGGAYHSTLNNSLIFSNSSPGSYPTFSNGGGGGTCMCILTNCILAYNTAGTNGGGDYQSKLVNCTVVGNSTMVGGGGFNSTAENCILYYNFGGDYYSLSTAFSMNYCCTTSPTNGSENITNAPLFVNLAGGDFHLLSNSPCINSGNNAYVTGATDLDGNPRVVGGTADIGAYEYQKPTSILSYAWAQQYGLPTDGSVDYADLDGTGFNVYQDWIAGLNPTNALSVLAMLPPAPTNNPTGLVVSWESVSNRTYFLQSSTNLGVHPAFSTIQSNIIGQTGTTTYDDTNAIGNGPFFYRVGVQQ